jgi:Protein of unknown function (DUF2806)
MTKKSDVLDNAISLEVALTKTGVDLKVKSRFLAACDRLFGSGVELVNLPLERRTSRSRALIDSERDIIEATGKAFIARINSDPEFADRAIENHMRNIAREQSNKDAVARVAFEDLKRLPAPDETVLTDAPDNLDDDWLNMFEPFAEKATSERMRDLFGKILSGEIRRPGAFSLSTLRVASEMNQRTAKQFQSIVNVRFADTIPHFDLNNVHELLDLEGCGLVSYGGGTITGSLQCGDDRMAVLKGQDFVVFVECHYANVTQQFRMVRLTQVGYELARLLPNDELSALKIAVRNSGMHFFQAKIHRMIALHDEKYKIGELIETFTS